MKEFKKDYVGTFDIDMEFDGNKYLSGSNKTMPGPDIDYIVNSNKFRSQEFTNFNSNDFNILFGGDSFTFGDSLPEECCYPAMIKNKIGIDCEIYNVAWSGASIHQSIKNVLGFIRKYGSPNYLVLLLPTAERGIMYDKFTKTFNRALHELEWVTNYSNISMKEKIRFYRGFRLEESMLLGIDMMHMLEELCELKGINLLWSTYDGEQYDIYKQCGFNNLFSTEMSPEQHNRINKNNLPYWEIAKDNSHPGSKYHESLSDIVLSKMLLTSPNIIDIIL